MTPLRVLRYGRALNHVECGSARGTVHRLTEDTAWCVSRFGPLNGATFHSFSWARTDVFVMSESRRGTLVYFCTTTSAHRRER